VVWNRRDLCPDGPGGPSRRVSPRPRPSVCFRTTNNMAYFL
jgi:hypothetical protein